jgi:hypothetical protein
MDFTVITSKDFSDLGDCGLDIFVILANLNMVCWTSPVQPLFGYSLHMLIGHPFITLLSRCEDTNRKFFRLLKQMQNH